MVQRMAVTPTRGNLIRIRRTLAFARQGHDLLEKKRDVLITELMALADDAEDAQRKAEAELAAAYEALGAARMVMGDNGLRAAALAAGQDAEVEILERSVMGVVIPTIAPPPAVRRPRLSLSGTTSALDQAMLRFSEAVQLLCTMAELLAAVRRLSSETQRTQRRINALKKVLIPRYEATVKFIAESLEEEERESFMRTKIVKAMLETRRKADHGRESISENPGSD